ncbi:hypothetical protein [Adhaeribacter aquaticus]|uniref:hypothetical protein n=1 Tax=Adhaeribacter aquaticus TaxID=299567 RepID=UPI000419847F|nr:hypothetical protein [Adhaeribacter aquaticus]
MSTSFLPNPLTSPIDYSAFLVPPSRQVRKDTVFTTPHNIEPEWREESQAYLHLIYNEVDKAFKTDPKEIKCFFSVKGKGHREWKDVSKAIDKGDAEKAIEEMDDLITKLITMRLKVSKNTHLPIQ